jgi:hypothetical protein
MAVGQRQRLYSGVRMFTGNYLSSTPRALRFPGVYLELRPLMCVIKHPRPPGPAVYSEAGFVGACVMHVMALYHPDVCTGTAMPGRGADTAGFVRQPTPTAATQPLQYTRAGAFSAGEWGMCFHYHKNLAYRHIPF